MIWQRSCHAPSMLLKLWAPLANFTPPLLLLEDAITAGLCAWSGGIPPIRVDAGSWCCTFLSPQERMALERRIPTKLSALKDRLIAAFDKSLYLSSHSREIAWASRLETTGKYTLEKLEHFKEAFTKHSAAVTLLAFLPTKAVQNYHFGSIYERKGSSQNGFCTPSRALPLGTWYKRAQQPEVYEDLYFPYTFFLYTFSSRLLFPPKTTCIVRSRREGNSLLNGTAIAGALIQLLHIHTCGQLCI